MRRSMGSQGKCRYGAELCTSGGERQKQENTFIIKPDKPLPTKTKSVSLVFPVLSYYSTMFSTHLVVH